MSDKANIQGLIPHRPPMLLVDEVTEWNKHSKTIQAQKTIRNNEFFLQGHYPDFPIVPGVITLECIFQTGAILLSLCFDELTQGNKVPVVSRVGKAKFSRMIRPNEEITLKAEVTEQVSTAYYLKGSAEVDGKVAARVDFVCMAANREESNT